MWFWDHSSSVPDSLCSSVLLQLLMLVGEELLVGGSNDEKLLVSLMLC